MRLWIAALVAALTILFGTGWAFASEPTQPPVDITRQLEEIGADELVEELPDETTELLRQLDLGEIDFLSLLSLTPGKFFSVLWALLIREVKAPLVSLAAVLGIVVLCAFLDGMKNTVGDATLGPVFNVVAVLSVSATIALPVLGCIRDTGQTIRDCANFLLSLIPVLTGVMTAGGQPMTAATYNLFLFSACQLAAQFAVSTLVPLLGIYMAFCMVGAVMPQVSLSSAASLLKTIITWSLGVMVSLFVGLMTIQSLVANAGDTVTTKATKFVIGSFVPVVGSALSDAFMAAQGCIRLLKTTLGGFGAVAVAVTFLPALLRVAIWYLTVNTAGVIGEVLGVGPVSALLKSISSTLGILISIILTFLLMVIATTTVLLLMGVGA